MGYETKMIVGYICSQHVFLNDEDNETTEVVFSDKLNEYYKYVENKKVLLCNQEIKNMFSATVLLTISMIDLCKCGGMVSDLISKSHCDASLHRGAFFDLLNGNKYITFDKYSSPMYLIPVQEALDIFQKENKSSKYRRYEMAIGLLKAVINNFNNQFEPCYVMFYSY